MEGLKNLNFRQKLEFELSNDKFLAKGKEKELL